MKNIRFILTTLFLAAFTVSCDTDGGESELDLRVGAVSDITQNPELPTILNLIDLQEGQDITFGFTVDVAQGNVTSADVVGLYQTASGEIYGPVTLQAGITQFPTELTLSTSDVVNAFSELNSLDDFQLADNLIITTKLYLQDGTEIELWDENGRLYGSDILSSTIYNVDAFYPVGCPLNGSFAGDYQVTITGAGPFGAFAESGVYNLQETSQTQRTIALSYLPGAGGFGQSAVLEFVCGTVSVPVIASGIGCGTGSISYGSTDDGVEIDPADDSSFTLTITDFITDGGCGGAAYPVTLEFEKI
ncbi:hypothetical protein [Gillisia limnaea]|uniref:Lipoprotein n=1 Tax=Gillisia limnaea (strain DSM 15749 / LMG 21470 / R-8282) TaxID=865937 RepID=H2BZD6_GILLR|nr:hypothetical protein [Gillisia limnaea]EHQ02299.1 hypothetical protein Gilli_1652 [Gillisia limnaea DSM 15749]EHQ02301.1 hypothetical protein Gilli_1654 [Gillisia limnaea DSM 15749]